MDFIKIKLNNYNTEKEEVELQFMQDMNKFGDDAPRLVTNSISLAAGMIGKMLPPELQTEYIGILVRTASDMLAMQDMEEYDEEDLEDPFTDFGSLFEGDLDDEDIPKNAVRFKPGKH